jgi:hypothetical protein
MIADNAEVSAKESLEGAGHAIDLIGTQPHLPADTKYTLYNVMREIFSMPEELQDI